MRRLLIPETVQTSAMDCGPAALKSLLEGHGIRASYGRLREACQTDVDGTSIDSLEGVAILLGLQVSQIMLPADFLFEPEAKALPSLIVIRQPGGATHFVILWRKHGSWFQLMDPAVGRRWVHRETLRKDLYVHGQPVAAAGWREWAGGEEFLGPLRRRLRWLGAPAEALITTACGSEGAVRLARLDAAARMVAGLVEAGAVTRGKTAARMTQRLHESHEEIPREYWSAWPTPSDQETLIFRGAVLLQVTGVGEAQPDLPGDLSAALSERLPSPGWAISRELFADGLPKLGIVAAAILLSAAGVVAEAVLWRSLLNVSRELVTAGQRGIALGQVVALGLGMFALEYGLVTGLLASGRRLETRLRVRFFSKVPLLGDRYFRSRPISDMAQRVHNVQVLRNAPMLVGQFWRATAQVLATLVGIGWLYPDALPLTIVVAAGAIGIPLAVQPMLAERDLKVRTHAGALTRYYLDALLGLTAIRAHGAARALRHEQGELLGEWMRAARDHYRVVVVVETLQFTLALGVSAWLLWSRLAAPSGDAGTVLLLAYWVLSLPMLGREIASIAWQYPMQRNTALRLAEPLGAPEEAVVESLPQVEPVVACELVFEGIRVQAAGRTILEDISLRIPAGEHVGIVGPSGAGKSSFVGLLLGWHRPARGKMLIDGRPFDERELASLRRETAWVDPQVQLWNETLYDNLRYGAEETSGMEEVLELSELQGVVARLPDGLQTRLGEGGGLVSGGEGQRVRFGRAVARKGVRLAILDEPARGLDRRQRRSLLERARGRWKNATLLCITHDVSDTLGLERVLVIDEGRIVEDGKPHELANQSGSRYAQLLEAERSVRHTLWNSPIWRRLRMDGGELMEGGAAADSDETGNQRSALGAIHTD